MYVYILLKFIAYKVNTLLIAYINTFFHYPGPERGCSEATGQRKRAAAEIRRPAPRETDALAEVLSRTFILNISASPVVSTVAICANSKV